MTFFIDSSSVRQFVSQLRKASLVTTKLCKAVRLVLPLLQDFLTTLSELPVLIEKCRVSLGRWVFEKFLSRIPPG